MKLHSLKLSNVRIHQEFELTPHPQFTILTGPNGVGKTSVVDAIHMVCMSRSFVTKTDRWLARKPGAKFHIEASFSSSQRSKMKLECQYDGSEKPPKQFYVNGSPLEKLHHLIGRVPVVVISSEDHELSHEGPAFRRSFLDGFLAQLSPAYLESLLRFRQVRRQRNALLGQFAQSGRGGYAEGRSTSDNTLKQALEPWNEPYAKAAVDIVRARITLVEELEKGLQKQFSALGAQSGAQPSTTTRTQPTLEYKTFVPQASSSMLPTVEDALVAMEAAFDREQERGLSLIGPHRDELAFGLNGLPLRQFGSQGQHRLFVLALKLAEAVYFHEHHEEPPILILDDVFGNLDDANRADVCALLDGLGLQVFITSATTTLFDSCSALTDKNTLYVTL
ncbi:MAG TPA: DNA replication and repair protein RecF [Bacteroidetes bacterium]|nr:MAG: DNA replication and repair protein RecF [Rhodothermaceae bacterium TMED105]HBD42681.1 DNA replication and repair protein RecF [Bacteroidota bacterium]HBV99923.1 DNA replication and repair protein RecF [Bacteroidota bacterium]|tara:strand:+ start:423 stop:1598 length:1176 start_codon:yes stop_codon:yes gene_type:complete